MSSTIDDFRNFFRPHKEALPFSARAAINDAISLVAASFRNHSVEVGLEPGEDAIIDGFPNEYSQVLINLLVNAKEAIRTHKVANGKVSIRLTRDGQWATVSIADNGGGIPPTILGKIFEPYFSTKEMGTGIGLYMSKMIIEKSMHGYLRVRNQGSGAEFAIRCPLSAKQSG
jgi:signal transduction histidine kinase